MGQAKRRKDAGTYPKIDGTCPMSEKRVIQDAVIRGVLPQKMPGLRKGHMTKGFIEEMRRWMFSTDRLQPMPWKREDVKQLENLKP